MLRRFKVGLVALALSLLLNVAFTIHYTRSGGLRRQLLALNLVGPPLARHDWQIADEARLRALPRDQGGVFFMGDSLIASGPWTEFYKVHNRGIPGERTDDLLPRLDAVTRDQPRQIFLLIGSNDLSVGVPPVQILGNLRQLLTRIHTESPATRTTVLGVLPINPGFWPPYSNYQVETLNNQIRDLVAEFPTARFADVGDPLRGEAGELRREFTTDGLHLNFDGYLALEKRVRDLLDQ